MIHPFPFATHFNGVSALLDLFHSYHVLHLYSFLRSVSMICLLFLWFLRFLIVLLSVLSVVPMFGLLAFAVLLCVFVSSVSCSCVFQCLALHDRVITSLDYLWAPCVATSGRVYD